MSCLKKTITFTQQPKQRKRFNQLTGEIYMSKFYELEAIFDEIIEEVEEETLEALRSETLDIAAERFIEKLDDEDINLSKAMKKKIEQTYNIEL